VRCGVTPTAFGDTMLTVAVALALPLVPLQASV
jgi:hypothetical protein